jgi:hypothetical protein
LRTADGAVTVRATRITEAIRLDGRLDEQVYSAIAPIVYSDGRDTTLKGYPALVNRAFIVKINRLLRF